MIQYRLCGIILALCVGGCNSQPLVTPGTIQTAKQLILRLGGGYDATTSSVTVQVCINYSGICVPQTTAGVACHDYSEAEFTLDNILIPQVAPGGDRGEAGCSFPIFKTKIPSQQLAMDGPHKLTLRIAAETVSVIIPEMFSNRQMKLIGGKLVGGSDARVVVEPRPTLIPEYRIDFVYDVWDLNGQWCRDKLKEVNCFDPRLDYVPPSSWNEQGFTFPVSTNMPQGVGTMDIDGSFSASVMPCPFSDCRVRVGHLIEIAGVEVIQP